MVETPTQAEVLAGYQGDPIATGDLSSDDADTLIDEAQDMFDSLFGDKILYTGEVEDESNAVRLLARHKWAIALGDTVTSESQEGASANYNVPTSTERSLSRTVYGQEFLEYTRDTPNIGVFRTR